MTLAIASPDEMLVARIARGDQSAFAELYQQHFQGIYDFALRTTHHTDHAEDVVQHTFTRAWEHLQKNDPPENVKAWLYTVARNAAIDEIRRGKRVQQDVADEEGFSFIANEIDPDRLSNPEVVARDHELVSLVWEAASALNEREYSLLDMHLRRDLSADEIAEAMGLRRDHVYMLLSRMRDSLEEAVTFLVLLRDRRNCPELDALLMEKSNGVLTPIARRLMRKHVQTCEVCQERRKRLAPIEILAGIAPVPVGADVKDYLWRRIETEINTPPTNPSGRHGDGRTSAGGRATLQKLAMMLTGGALGLFLLIALISRPVESAEALPPSPPTSIPTSTRPANSSSSQSLVLVALVPSPEVKPAEEHATASPEPVASMLESAETEPEAASEVEASEEQSTLSFANQESEPIVMPMGGEPTPTVQPAIPFAPSSPTVTQAPAPTAPAILTSTPERRPTRTATTEPTPRPTRTPTAEPEPTAAPMFVPTEPPAPTELPTPPELPTPTPTEPPSTPMPVVIAEPTSTPTVVQPTATTIIASVPLPESSTGTSSPIGEVTVVVPTRTPIPTSTRQPTETPLPPTNTPTRVPSMTPTSPATPTSTTVSCPALDSVNLTARPVASTAAAAGQIILNWTANGGCAPYSGTITARYAQQTPYHTYQISTRNGTLTDAPPRRCEGTFTVQYNLVLRDAAGSTVTDTATTQVTWNC